MRLLTNSNNWVAEAAVRHASCSCDLQSCIREVDCIILLISITITKEKQDVSFLCRICTGCSWMIVIHCTRELHNSVTITLIAQLNLWWNLRCYLVPMDTLLSRDITLLIAWNYWKRERDRKRKGMYWGYNLNLSWKSWQIFPMVFLLDVSYHVSWQFELYPVDIITGGGKHAKFACVFFFGLYLYAHIFSTQ